MGVTPEVAAVTRALSLTSIQPIPEVTVPGNGLDWSRRCHQGALGRSVRERGLQQYCLSGDSSPAILARKAKTGWSFQ